MVNWEIRDQGKKKLAKIAERTRDAYRFFEDQEVLHREINPKAAKLIKKKRHNFIIETIIENLKSDLDYPDYPIFCNRHYKTYRPDLVIKCFEQTFYDMFHCRNFWVEFEVDSKVGEEKIDNLKEILSHDWAILILSKDGTYRIERPHTLS